MKTTVQKALAWAAIILSLYGAALTQRFECTTDTECMQMRGGDGGPQNAEAK